MKKSVHFSRSIGLLLCLSVFSGITAAADALPAGAVAVVNGKTLSTQLFEQNLSANVQQGAPDTPQLRQFLKEEMIARELFAQEATRLGIDKTPEAEKRLAFTKQSILVELLIEQKLAKKPITESDLKAEYERETANLGSTSSINRYKISTIVTAQESQASAALKAIRSGASFEKVAQETSIDASKTAGGRLDWLLQNQLNPEILTAVAGLKKGGLAQTPIQVKNNWVVVRLDETQNLPVPSFEASKPALKAAVLAARKAELLTEIKQNAKVIQ